MIAPPSRTDWLVIMGGGYTARWVYRLAQESGRYVVITSRQPDRHVPFAAPAHRLRFDLDRLETWTSIPPGADLLWCFPAEPLEQVSAFARQAGLKERRLVVLGSTSAYDVAGSRAYPPPWVDETTPVDQKKPRVQGEEFLRKECGAIVLRVAGIYGPGRNPLDWIEQGRVGPTSKYVNLIHVEDLAAVCLAALERGERGEAYNVSDGTPRTWESIHREAARRWPVSPPTSTVETGPGKRILAKRLPALLGDRPLRHPDLLAALETLERKEIQPGG